MRILRVCDPWLLHATTRRQSFADTPVVPGQFYEYRVRAVGSRSVSNFSYSAVVYGMLYLVNSDSWRC